MSVLSYNELVELVRQGVINAPEENINPSSIDIRLSDTICVESEAESDLNSSWFTSINTNPDILLAEKKNINMIERKISNTGYTIEPGEFILASSVEIFNLPDDIVCQYVLKSSLARNGLQHLMAGWCDPGWTNSTLTLELKNLTRYNYLNIKPGMKIGQMIFHRVNPVPAEQSYAKKGQYNNQTDTQQSKGVR